MKTIEPKIIINDSEENLGLAQWQCIDNLKARYGDSEMIEISELSSFHDNQWFYNDPHLKKHHWVPKSSGYKGRDATFKDDEFPLMMLCKIVCYRKMALELRPTSILRMCKAFYNLFIDVLRQKNILIANKNGGFKSISCLTTQDIKLVAELHVAKSFGSLSQAPFAFLEMIKALSNDAIKEAPFYSFSTTLPWKEENISLGTWIGQLKRSQGYEAMCGSYPAIPIEQVNQVINPAIKWLDNLGMFEEIFDWIKQFVEEKGRWRSHFPILLKEKIFAKYYDELNAIFPFRYTSEGRLSKGWLRDLMMVCHGAAIWIILLTVGIRNVDIRNLKVGCCKPSQRNDLLYYIVLDIEKTQQRNYVLPVPEYTYRAVKLLEFVRYDFDCPYLVTTLQKGRRNDKPHKSGIYDGGTINRRLCFFLTHYQVELNFGENSDQEATAHCIRATLAGWIGANSNMAILLLRRLFGHTNVLMPDAYLCHNPIIIEQRKRNINEAQQNLAEDIAKGMINGRIAGTKGNQLLKGKLYIEDSLSNSLTEMDTHVSLKQRIKEMLLQRMVSGDIYALKTPMGVICLRNCNDTSDTPCAKAGNTNKRRAKNIAKEITDALGTMPNPAQCVGKDCKDALIGKPWSQPLKDSFDYYLKYLEGIGYQGIDVKFEAQNFVAEYGPLLEQVYGEQLDA
ncbi:hypothetical protein AB6D81_02035 [Vibrio splendidus]